MAGWPIEGIAEDPLDHDLVGQADPEHQPPAGCRLGGERLGGEHERVARVGRDDRRPQLDVGDGPADHRQQGQSVVAEDLGRPGGGEPGVPLGGDLGDDAVDVL